MFIKSLLIISHLSLLFWGDGLITPSIAAEDIFQLEEQAMKKAAEIISPSIVRIETTGGLQQVDGVLVGSSPTTGLIVSEDGYILSSSFNFVQKPSAILVLLADGSRASARIVARDNSRMLVLLKIETSKKLAVPTFTKRSEMAVGQWTLATGKTFQSNSLHFTVGILSAKNRIWGKAIQTDAAVSPSNYGGALIDIHGRVLGILVPLSPDRGGELAGVEWYDSGIGFAVPLGQYADKLEKLKKGKNLHRGVLGVSLKGSNIYSDPPLIAAVLADSPAFKAGIERGDLIIEVEGKKIVRQAQLKHQLESRYAEEKVHLVVLRENDKLDFQVELAEKLTPFQHTFLGILPLRSSSANQAGVTVRAVYPNSPAEKSGIEPRDHISLVNGRPIKDAAVLREFISAQSNNTELELTVHREDETQNIKVTTTTLPQEILTSLPPARDSSSETSNKEENPKDLPALGEVDVKIPEESNQCFAYVPPLYDPNVAYGIVIWLTSPGDYNRKQIIDRWKTYCDKHDLILLAPKPASSQRWRRTEIGFIKKTLLRLLATYNIDRSRIVVHGYQGGGSMAYLVAFSAGDLIRGVAAVDGVIPLGTTVPNTNPVNRIEFFAAVSSDPVSAKPAAESVKLLNDEKHPVIEIILTGKSRYLNSNELDQLILWIDSLDKI